MKQIEIEELRISSDGKFLEFGFNCPGDYYFTEFTITVRNDPNQYSLAEDLFYDEDGNPYTEEKHYVGSVPISEFGVDYPTIYDITLKALPVDEDKDPLEVKALISDVKEVYDCLMGDIKALDAKCTDSEIQDRVIRNYLILYAHQEALHLHETLDAYRWFDMMQNCFSGPCSNTMERKSCGCGCGRQINVKPSCGCGK